MCVIWCSLLLLWSVVGAQVATSGYKLAIVCHKEGHLIEALDLYVTNTLLNHSHVDETVERFLEKVKKERSGIGDITEWIGHPINAYFLVERTANSWKDVKQCINCSTCTPTDASQDFLSSWKNITDDNGIWTSMEDVSIAANGLGRLHHTYDLDIKTLMSGTILNASTSPLTTSDVINIANYLEEEFQVTWYEDLLEVVNDTVKESVLYNLAIANHVGGFSWKALDILTDLQKTSKRPMEDMIQIIRQKAETSGEDKPIVTWTSDTKDAYQKLCRQNSETNQVTSYLNCYNKVTRIPYYTVKEEVLSYVPRISRLHDVISDEEILQLQDACNQDIKPSSIIGADGKTIVNFRFRNGQNAIVEPTKNISLKLEKRVELLTGLDTFYRKDVNTSQYFNTVNYGIGGHFLQHLDAVNSRTYETEDWDNTFGDRIATWMFYLNTVEAGGATVFPILDLKILPIKGSAVFWYNLLPSGVIDERTLHASCPVLLGTKWVTTKWILEYGQEFRKPCKTNSMDEHF